MTTTQKPTNPSGQHGASELIVPPIDPENEVDGKSIVLWLTAALIFVVASLWLLAVVFGFSVQGARYDKIDLAPTVELQRTRSAEDVWLRNPKLTLAQWTEQTKQAVEDGTDKRALPEIEASILQQTDLAIRNYVK